MNNSIKLVCPNCKAHLTLADENKYNCNQCECTWPIIESIPHFIDTDVFWGEPGFTREILQKINEDMRHKNWNDILSNHQSPLIREQYSFISDMERAKWQRLIDLPRDSIVLDIGAGMGTISQALSKQNGLVYAIEPVKERTDFMRLRFKQESCNNIKIIRSDIDHIPFSENSFNLIVLNGVVEWLPFSRKEENPRKAQLYYLQLLRSLLKQDGYIYIGIENRHCYGLFIGEPDPHIHIPVKYVTILPRFISHIICKYKIGDIYRPYLYSHLGYKRLLKDAGFQDIEIYSSLPSYNKPQNIISLKNNSNDFAHLIWNSKRKVSKFAKYILLKLNLLKYMGYAYIIFAKKG